MGLEVAGIRAPRCFLINVETAESVDCLFNPTQLTEKVSVNWNRVTVPGLSHQLLQFQSTGNRQIAGVEFYLDRYFAKEQSDSADILEFRGFLRALSGAFDLFKKKKDAPVDPLADIEVPTSWFLWGTLIFSPLVVITGAVFFQIKWWMALFCIFLSFFLAIVACRATGETDTTPSGALGKVTQLASGLMAPGSVTTNLMSANISAGIAIHSSRSSSA